MSSQLRIKYVKQQWVVQKSGRFLWYTISKGFDKKQSALKYVADLQALSVIEKLFKGHHSM